MPDMAKPKRYPAPFSPAKRLTEKNRDQAPATHVRDGCRGQQTPVQAGRHALTFTQLGPRSRPAHSARMVARIPPVSVVRNHCGLPGQPDFASDDRAAVFAGKAMRTYRVETNESTT